MRTQLERYTEMVKVMDKAELIDWTLTRLIKAKSYLASKDMHGSADVCIADAFELLRLIVK